MASTTVEINAEVKTVPHIAGGVTTEHSDVMIMGDNGWQYINTVSPNYQLVTNETAMGIANEIMSNSEHVWSPVKTMWNGKRMSSFYKTQDAVAELPRVGDTIAMGLRVDNSYDGSSSFGYALMAYVLSCTNGLVSDRLFGTFRMKHVGNSWDMDAAKETIIGGTQRLIEFAPRIDALGGHELELSHVRAIGLNPAVGPTFLGGWLNELPKGDVDMWTACQKGTSMLTEEMNDKGRFATVRRLEGFSESFMDIGHSLVSGLN